MAFTERLCRLGAAALTALALAGPAAAHEFWIAPESFRIAPDAALVAQIRIGSDMEGTTFPYLPNRFTRFEVHSGDTVLPLPGRIGDSPAINVSGLPEGLDVVVYASTPSVVTYDDAEVYARFLEEKDLGWVAERNAARGLEPVGLTEQFSRCAKALVAVGDGAGEDRATGLKTELVAGLNPYVDDLSQGMPLHLLLDGAPRGDSQVEVFQRLADGSVAHSLHRTDAAGEVRVPVTPGAFVLVNAVAMEEIDVPGGAKWHSYWASLTFRAPD